MTRNDFITLIDTYGTTPDRWPVDVLDAALAFMASSDEAATLMDSSATLDALLDDTLLDNTLLDNNGQPKPVRAETLNAILDIPTSNSQVRRRQWLSGLDIDLRFMLPRLVGMSAMAVLGFYIGVAGLVTLPGTNDDDAIYNLTDIVFDTLSEENIL